MSLQHARRQPTSHYDRAAAASAVPTVDGLRRRHPSDLAGAAELLLGIAREGHCPARMEGGLRNWLDDEDVLGAWVVERKGEIVGHVAISHVGVHGHQTLRWRDVTGVPADDLLAVSRFFVAPAHRRKGIGAALLQTATTYITSHDLRPVAEVISPDAVRLFERRGWTHRGLFPAPSKTDPKRLVEYFELRPDHTRWYDELGD